ncbi:winged helix-turn-helix transcriptional regulator [Microbacterium sp. CFBP 8794]|uniref:winged helix-turn-helix transcriptional regulator n=1 Tax=Microbacterium sp. CFBP 8794 TaxID=2775269 RepID=UPI0031405CBF
MARFLSLLDGPWATLIVRELLNGPCRFGQLKDALPGISAHTLTDRLRRFEAYGIVTRTSYPETPPRVGHELINPLAADRDPIRYGNSRHLSRNNTPLSSRSVRRCRGRAAPVSGRRLRARAATASSRSTTALGSSRIQKSRCRAFIPLTIQ